jgi:hypothetical protein
MKSLLIICLIILSQSYIEKAQAQSTPTTISQATQKVKRILTPEQRQARRTFIKTYGESTPEVQLTMKRQVKTDPALRSKLGLNPIQSPVSNLTPQAEQRQTQSPTSTQNNNPEKPNIVPRPPLGPALSPPMQTYKLNSNKENPNEKK